MKLWGTITDKAGPGRPGTLSHRIFLRITKLNTVLFRLSKGRIGGSFDRAPTLLLHHVGRKSGEARVSPLVYLADGADCVVIASYGGSDKHPAWFLNVREMPETEIELKGGRRRVRVHVLDSGEKARMWPRVVDMYPSFQVYQDRSRGREIPLVRLSPV